MPPYKIFETGTFRRDLKKQTSPFEGKIIMKKLQSRIYPQLREEPHFGTQIKKLKGYQPESWRYRIGHFRLFYSIDDEKGVVIITSLRLRKEAYR